MKNKIALVTGANSGTGKWTTIHLAKKGATVVMLCRHKIRGEEALKEMMAINKEYKIDLMFCDLGSIKSIRAFCNAYSQSKLANLLFTYELAKKLKGKGVTVNALHPGAVATSMGINRDTGFGKLITKSLRPFFQTAEEGAATAIYLPLLLL